MSKIENLGRELQNSSKAQQLEKLAMSEDAKKLGKMFDAETLSAAAENCDGKAMKKIVQDVLKSEEGRRLAENLRKLMEG